MGRLGHDFIMSSRVGEGPGPSLVIFEVISFWCGWIHRNMYIESIRALRLCAPTPHQDPGVGVGAPAPQGCWGGGGVTPRPTQACKINTKQITADSRLTTQACILQCPVCFRHGTQQAELGWSYGGRACNFGRDNFMSGRASTAKKNKTRTGVTLIRVMS